jgi:hypothetical protein
MQRSPLVSAEDAHRIYEEQVAALDTRMLAALWERIAAAAGASAGPALRVERDERTLTLTDPASGRALRFEADDVLDLPERKRPGPFLMGNARVALSAWDSTRRAWLLRHIATGDLDYAWVTLPGDVVDDAMLASLVDGLRRGTMPDDPARLVSLDVASPETGVASLATGRRWAIVNLYSGQRQSAHQVFGSGAEAGAALAELVRRGELQEGDWEVRPVSMAERS